MSALAIETVGLTKFYGSTRALERIHGSHFARLAVAAETLEAAVVTGS